MNVENKVIVVTGAGNGMGRQIALQLIEKGAKVACVDINREGMEETKKLANMPGRISLHQVNIAQSDQVNQLVKEVLLEHGSVDGLINNAGIIQPFIPLAEVKNDVIDRVMDVNFYGTLNMVKAFLPELLQRPDAHIVNVSSMGGFLPVPGQSIYGASKAAVKLMSEGMAAELKDTNVGISVVIPGGIKTDIKKNSNIQAETSAKDADSSIILSPEKAASLIIKAMESNKTVSYIGKDCKIMKNLYKLSPKLAGALINKVMDPSKH